MRVTSNTFPKALADQLGRLALRQNRLQNQAATGQRIQSPEDDPAGLRRVLDLQTETRTLRQYKRNIERHQEVAQISYGVVKSLKTISDRAGEIATLADGLKSPAEMRIYADEVMQMIRQAVQLANSKHRGDYLFSGTKSDQAPFAVATDADGKVTAVTYQGNTSVAESEIAEGVTITAQTLGANTTGSGPRGLLADSRAGADFFNHLIALQNNLRANNAGEIQSNTRAQLAQDEENFLMHVGANGALQARLETTAALATNRALSLEGLTSQEADADLAQTLVRLSETQNAYRAALQSGATILNRSLLDFLR
ncbi:MAG: flagellar hook-associated protein FlgL [Chloroflexi bacterium]|nr:flagellar hook-associated protein FlgL [Chloroflexota bacterium]